jgi:hypothetical protein
MHAKIANIASTVRRTVGLAVSVRKTQIDPKFFELKTAVSVASDN